MKINLSEQLQDILNEYGLEVQEKVNRVLEEQGKKAVKELKDVSPRRGSRRNPYHKTWKVKKEYSGRGDIMLVVHNDKNYRLTHLLEKGHAIVKNGRTVGRARAFPHIAPVEQSVVETVEMELMNELRE